MLDSGAEGPGSNRSCDAVHTHCASVHQAAKLVAVLLRLAGVTAGLAESNSSLTAKNWDQLRNPTLGNRVWATFTCVLCHALHKMWHLSSIFYGLCICLSWSRLWALQKRLNRSRRAWTVNSDEPKESCVSWGPGPTPREVALFGGGHTWAYAELSAVDIFNIKR